MYVDTHCHLNFSSFIRGEEKILDRAKKVGVEVCVVPGIDKQTSLYAAKLSERLWQVYAAVGIHPHELIGLEEEDVEDMVHVFRDILATNSRVVAVGEVGFDAAPVFRSRNPEPVVIKDTHIARQKDVFIRFYKLALDYDRALIVHSRNTADVLLETLQESMRITGQIPRLTLHCCEPEEKLLEFALRFPHVYLGVNGDLTYSLKKQEFYMHAPLEKIVLETDAPYLLPEPLRSQKKYPNVPANIPVIARCLAQIKRIPVDEVARTTTKNAQELFVWP